MRRFRALAVAATLMLALAVAPAGAALMAVDLGSEFIKISMIKPGRIPISIVNNEMSKRKSPAAVAFVNGDRLVGDEAAALAVRYPDRVFTRVRDLLGRSFDDPTVSRILNDARLPFKAVQAPNRTTVALDAGADGIFTVEEVVASLFEYAKRLATAAAEGPVTDTVLVVPAFWGPAQRQALLDAADLAGLNVLSLVHAHAAAALQYGIERDFTNKTEHVLLYDLGGGSAEAALVKFSSYHPKGAKDAVPQFEVRDVAWVEHSVGCDALETALVDHFAASHAAGADAVLAAPRAVAKLRKQVKRTKEILSANTEAPVIVEELLEGQDFRGRISREEFEGLVGDLWDRAVAPVKAIMARNNLTADDLAAVELLGGCSRVPRVKAALSEALGGRGLDMHLDADEAVVLGAGLVAANLSTIFRLRKFGMTDKSPYAVTFTMEGAEEATGADGEVHDPSTPRTLVPALRRIPSKRAIALHNLTSDGFTVKLTLDTTAGAALPCCARTEPLGEYAVSGVHKVVEKHGAAGKVALHAAVDASGVFRVDRADAAVEVEEEVKIKVKVAGGDASDKGSNSTEAGPDAGAGANTTDAEAPAGGNATDAAAGEGKKAKEEETYETKTELRRRIVRVPLNVTGGLALPGMTAAQKKASRKVMRGLREADEAKRATAKARNDLEAYIIATREKMESSEALAAVSTEEQRAAVREALMDAEDWLYGDGDAAAAGQLRDRLKEVRQAGDAIEGRAAEAAARPEAVKAALEFADLALKAANTWPTTKPWLNETEVAALVASVDEYKTWIEGAMKEQEARPAHEEPVFKVGEVAKRMDPVRKAFTRLNSKPKPVEKKPEAPKAEGNDTTIPEGAATGPEGEEAAPAAEEAGAATGAGAPTGSDGHDEL